ncbi:MAG: RluA family pseudouridine synthase [Phycisphaerales bacterium]
MADNPRPADLPPVDDQAAEADLRPGDDQPADDMAEVIGGLIASGGKVDRDALFALYERQRDGDEEKQVSVTFRLFRNLEKRLDRYLVDRIPFLSRTALQRLIDEGAVTVNGRPPKASTKLRAGDIVSAILPPPPSSEIPAEEIPLEILYEDDDLIAINKAANIIVHPARGNKSGTIINALAWHFQHRSGGALSSVGREHARPGVVHRLDRHTTGVMIAAKTDTAHWRLGKQFELRRTDKRYLALVHGRIESPADVIDLPLGKHPAIREKYAVRWDETGKPSVTIYRVRELYDGFTLVELELKTGRTHQIRVHLSHIGYPIVGDDMYGGRHLRLGEIAGSSVAGAGTVAISRQCLHAATLGFRHPISGAPMQLSAPLPEDMRRLVALLRAHRAPEAVDVPGATVDLSAALSATT